MLKPRSGLKRISIDLILIRKEIAEKDRVKIFISVDVYYDRISDVIFKYRHITR